jgi:indolepyruvate ferredoxin oxidoreductase beta subunit
MTDITKILISGVGGQGVVYVTNLFVEAALLSDLPVSSSEIHGLSQRSGSVSSMMTFGENSYGFIEQAGANFLIGLELLEAQRGLPFLNSKSKAIIDNNKILPYAVNAQMAEYPDSFEFIDYLKKHIEEVIFIENMPGEVGYISRNLFVVGCASQLDGFPLGFDQLHQAVQTTSRDFQLEMNTRVFELGKEFMLEKMTQ